MTVEHENLAVGQLTQPESVVAGSQASGAREGVEVIAGDDLISIPAQRGDGASDADGGQHVAGEVRGVSRRTASKTAAKKPASRARPAAKKVATKKATAKKATAKKAASGSQETQSAKFPRHSVMRALRMPKVILDENAGHASTQEQVAGLLGVSVSGPFRAELSSAKKYGFLEAQAGKVVPTARAKRALRPTAEHDTRDALREAVLGAPDFGDIYTHYRGEYLPASDTFFVNTCVEQGIPQDRVPEFREVFEESLEAADLLQRVDGRIRLVDIGRDDGETRASRSAGEGPRVVPPRVAAAGLTQSCFVMQPFSSPFDGYFESLFKPAIEAAGLRAVRADDEIFATGKIMDQVWRGIRSASVLLAELSTRNPNVYYELGLAHALGKPVVLISSNDGDVPFDVGHIRVVYYDRADPFWGQKLIDKISENLQSALSNPEEAIFRVSE